MIDNISETFLQYQGDNVDHASRTLDGSGTIHLMGQMATFSPEIRATKNIPRLTIKNDDLKRIGREN